MLYTHINYFGQRNIPIKHTSFYYFKELVLHSFNTHIMALFLINIQDKCDTEKVGEVEEYMRNLTLQQFLQFVENICIAGFGQEVGCDVNRLQLSTSIPSSFTNSQTTQFVDVEFLNHVQYMQVIKIYKTLKHAIKCVDIGLLKWMIVYICLYFASLSSRNYTFNMLYFWQLIAIDVYNPIF